MIHLFLDDCDECGHDVAVGTPDGLSVEYVCERCEAFLADLVMGAEP